MNLNKKIREEVAQTLADKATAAARESFDKYCASVAQVTVDAIWRHLEEEAPNVTKDGWLTLIRKGYAQGISSIALYDVDGFHGKLPSKFSERRQYIPCPAAARPLKPAEVFIPAADRKAIRCRRKEILAAYNEVYDASLQILNTCKTLKQLEATFPEAAALVPKPASAGTQLVDSKLVGQVQAMLEKGVPA